MLIRVNETTLNYESSGEGRPIVLLHGNGEDLHIFDALTQKLKHHYTVYAIDSRNHGLSQKTDDYGYQAMTDDVHHFIKRLLLYKPCVIGFSDGAIIALMLAMQHPQAIGKTVLLGVNLKPSDFRPENIEYLKGEYERTGDPLLELMLTQPDIDLADLRQVATPTLVVAAENDLFRPELYDEMVAVMPNASLLIMQGHEHETYVMGSDVLSDDIRQFCG